MTLGRPISYPVPIRRFCPSGTRRRIGTGLTIISLRHAILECMDPEIKIARDSARHHMTSRVPVITDGKTERDAQKLIEEGVRHFDTVNYVYIVDDKNVFKNVLSVKELFRHEPSTELKAVPKKENLISVKPATDQEKTVYAALKNNIKAVPVVDEDGALLGVVPNEAILKILYKETREDLLQLAGIHSGAIAYEDELGTP